MARTIKWGIIGCGRIAEKFASDLSLLSDCQVVACASKDNRRAQLFAGKFQISSYFDDYKSMLRSKDIDIVYIATTHNFHYSNIILCLENGKHVLCEKPLCTTKDELEKVIEVAKAKNVFLMEAMWTAFLPAFKELVNDVNKGIIGNVRYLKADFGFYSEYDPSHRLFNPSLGGGCILDIGIYPLFVSLEVLGLPIDIQVSKTIAPSGVENECAMQLAYEDGSTAALYATVTCNTSNILEIFGTHGIISVPSRFHEMTEYLITDKNGNKQIKLFEKIGYGYAHEIIHVSECIRNAIKESDVMTYGKSKSLMSLMEKAIKF